MDIKKYIAIDSQGVIQTMFETNDPTIQFNTPHAIVDVTGKNTDTGVELFSEIRKDRMKFIGEKNPGKKFIIRERKPEEIIEIPKRKVKI